MGFIERAENYKEEFIFQANVGMDLRRFGDEYVF